MKWKSGGYAVAWSARGMITEEYQTVYHFDDLLDYREAWSKVEASDGQATARPSVGFHSPFIQLSTAIPEK